jgi:hypothetical protein
VPLLLILIGGFMTTSKQEKIRLLQERIDQAKDRLRKFNTDRVDLVNSRDKTHDSVIKRRYGDQIKEKDEEIESIQQELNSLESQFDRISNENVPSTQGGPTPSPTDNKIVFAVAAIGAVATVLAALIGIFPQILSDGDKKVPPLNPIQTTPLPPEIQIPMPAYPPPSISTAPSLEEYQREAAALPEQYSPLDQDSAIQLIEDWGRVKRQVFAPPYNREIVNQYTTGNLREDLLSNVIPWLENNGWYWLYDTFEVIETWGFENSEKNRAAILAKVSENLQLYNNFGEIVPKESGSFSRTFRYFFEFDAAEEKWKIFDYCICKDDLCNKCEPQ